MAASLQDFLQDFIEQMGLLAERNGMPRTAGRLLGLLLVEEEEHEAFSLDEIAERLQVSKASASTNARLLERAGLLERAALPGDRRDFYRMGTCPWGRMFALARARFQEAKTLFETTAEALPEEHAAVRRRIAAWGAFYAFLLDDLDRRVDAWNEQRSA